MKQPVTQLSILLLFFSLTAYSQTEMHITEQLINSTIRIEAVNGSRISTGTGFFYDFKDSQNRVIPVIITNKHVTAGSTNIRLFFKKAINGKPSYGPPFLVTIPSNTNSIRQHPNNTVDLVALPIAGILDELKQNNIDVFRIATDVTIIANDSLQREDLKSIEDIMMIGYPNGLWDASNNLPVVRKGTTATTPYMDYNGKREFLIDIAAFPGSSGSPIYFWRDIYTDKKYTPKIGVKLYLLGILYAGPQYSAEGSIVRMTPNESTPFKTLTNIPMNIGFVIKSSEILGLKSALGIQ